MENLHVRPAFHPSSLGLGAPSLNIASLALVGARIHHLCFMARAASMREAT
jgi:hypothetical protein